MQQYFTGSLLFRAFVQSELLHFKPAAVQVSAPHRVSAKQHSAVQHVEVVFAELIPNLTPLTWGV